MNLMQRTAAVVNRAVRPLMISAGGRRLFGNWMTVVTYTGRRSGRTFSIPVAYSRRDDEVSIKVEIPGQKTWWRNFSGDGGQLLVRLDGVDRPGYGRAHRDADGHVTVAVRLAKEHPATT